MHGLDQHTNPPEKADTKLHHIPRGHKAKTHTKRNSRVTIDDPQMDYYSLDDHSGDSEEDSDHLDWLNPLPVVHPLNREGQIQRKLSQWHVLWKAPPLQCTL